jgi:hypothetical protein
LLFRKKIMEILTPLFAHRNGNPQTLTFASGYKGLATATGGILIGQGSQRLLRLTP